MTRGKVALVLVEAAPKLESQLVVVVVVAAAEEVVVELYFLT